MSATKPGIQLIILVAWPRFGGRNWKLLARPCIPSSSRAFRCVRPGPAPFSSIVPRVEVDPRGFGVRELSCKATWKILETERMIGALDELAKVSLILSWRLSYLKYGDDQDIKMKVKYIVKLTSLTQFQDSCSKVLIKSHKESRSPCHHLGPW